MKRDERGEPLRASVKLDKYAPRQIARDLRLTSKAREVLNILTLDADWRSECWTGTKKELAEDTLMSRNTVAKAIEELEDKGAIEILEPFKQGPESRGIVLLPLYEDMVKLSKGQIESRNSARFDPGPNAQQTRSKRAANAQQTRSSEHLRVVDQEVPDLRGVWLRGKGEVEDSGGPEDPKILCEMCREPVLGHPFSDHEPIPMVVAS
jgi:biotin operon repressor